MVFFFVAIIFLYIGRKLGWALSRNILYTSSAVTSGIVSAIWGCSVALLIFLLISWQQPNIILKIIFGYALGWYVAIPNFGLYQEDFIPSSAKERHLLISIGPSICYLIAIINISLFAK